MIDIDKHRKTVEVILKLFLVLMVLTLMFLTAKMIIDCKKEYDAEKAAMQTETIAKAKSTDCN